MWRFGLIPAAILLFCLSFLTPASAGGTVRMVYEERAGVETVRHEYLLEPAGAGFRLSIATRAREISEEYATDASFAILSWRYQDRRRDTAFTAVRAGDTIHVSGRHRGRPLERRFKAGTIPWKQLFPMGLEALAAGAEKKADFLAIDPDKMRIHAFTAGARGSEAISWRGRRVEAVHIRITLAGALAPLWHADSWHRAADGRYLRYESVNGPGAPLTVKELIEETDPGD
ncbi:MAG: hypothetical protein ACM3X6_12115 [Patescibacteria group bacterium]